MSAHLIIPDNGQQTVSKAVGAVFGLRHWPLEVDDQFEFDQFCRQVGTSRTAGDNKKRSRERQK